MPRAQGDPQSKVMQTNIEDHERDAMNEMLNGEGISRYKYLRALVLADLIERGYLVPVVGTVDNLWEGYRIKTARPQRAG